MKKPTFPDFNNKLVQFGVTGDRHTYTIYDPHFQIQGGRWFLIGTVPRGGSTGDWCEGATSAVAWDQVSDYLVFDSVKVYNKSLSNFNKYKRKH